MIDKSLILSKIKAHLGLKKESDFAKFLGIKQNTLSTWHSRNTFDIDLISQKCEFLNYNWLLTGTGEMLKKDDLIPEEHYNEIQSSDRSDDFKQKEIEMWKELYRMQAELMEEIKKDRDRLKNLMEEKNKA